MGEKLLDVLLPKYHLHEYHDIQVNASVEDVYRAVHEVDFSDSRIVKTLMTLRGLPSKKMTLEAMVNGGKFFELGENKPEEYVFGFVDPSEFTWEESSENPNAGIRVACNFLCEPDGNGGTYLSTETRIQCMNKKAESIFRLYWFFVGPFSAWMRMCMLKGIKKKAETYFG